MKTIWVVSLEIDYEGLTSPEAAFTSEVKAKTYADERTRAEEMNSKYSRYVAHPVELDSEE